MKKQQFLLPALLLQQFVPAYAQKANEQPNVILILSDDHSYPLLGCSGNPDLKTPNIDRMAKEGIQYHRAYTTAPQSVPSRASLMTGRNVLDVQMTRFSAPLKREFISYPEILKQNGYFTGICGRSFHLDGSGKKASETTDAFAKFKLQTFQDRVDYLQVGRDDLAIKQFLEFLNMAPANKPFFIQVGFTDPHTPFTAEAYEPDPKTLSIPVGMPDTELLRKDLAAHYGEIMRLDENIGKILNEIEKRKLKNTLIIFMGDNGSALLRGKGTLYDLGLHVPLVMKWDGKIKKGSNSYALFSGEDLAPTILEAANLPVPAEMTGKSFVKTFTNPDIEMRDVVFAIRGSHGSGLPGKSSSPFDLGRTVFTKDYKLIYNVLWQLPYGPTDISGRQFWPDMLKQHNEGKLKLLPIFTEGKRPMFELYDLKNDPNELNNLAGKAKYKDIEHKYKAILHEWMIIYSDYCPLPIEP